MTRNMPKAMVKLHGETQPTNDRPFSSSDKCAAEISPGGGGLVCGNGWAVMQTMSRLTDREERKDTQ